MFKLLHVWSSKETTGNEKKNLCDVKKNFLRFTVCKTEENQIKC